MGRQTAAAGHGEWWKRPHITVWKPNDTTIGGWDARAAGLGGWTLTPHHQYDPVSHVLYRGDGSRQATQTVDRVINAFAGNRVSGRARTRAVSRAPSRDCRTPSGMAVGADGSVYIADTANDVVRRVRPDGTMVIVAGRQRPSFYQPRGYSGDGGPATQADLYMPKRCRGRRRTGRCTSPTTATTASARSTRKRHHQRPSPATATSSSKQRSATAGRRPQASDPSTRAAIAVAARRHAVHLPGRRPVQRLIACAASDPTATISDLRRWRQQQPPTASRRQAHLTFNRFYNRIDGHRTSAPDGSLLHRLRRQRVCTSLTPDGLHRRRSPATASSATSTTSRRRGPSRPRLTRRSIRGRVADGAPTGSVLHRRLPATGACGGWTATATIRVDRRRWRPATHGAKASATVGRRSRPASTIPQGITTGPDGAIYIADWVHNTVRKISDPLPGFTGEDIAIASPDAGELYRFDKTGRHLQTRDTTTGRVTQTFGYTSSGRLDEIEDDHHNTIRIERDTTGEATAVIAPFGQRTELDLDTDGYLGAVRDPAARSTTMGYVRDGLLSTFTRPGGVTSQMTYDAGGRLTRDENADGAVKTLARSDSADAYQVALTTGMGRTKTNRVERTDGAATVRTMTGHDGLSTQTRAAADGTTTTTGPDGGSLISHRAGDPRFGLQAPYPAKIVATRPSGASATLTATRIVELADPDDTLSVGSITNTATIGTRTTTSRWDKAAGHADDDTSIRACRHEHVRRARSADRKPRAGCQRCQLPLRQPRPPGRNDPGRAQLDRDLRRRRLA